MNRTILTLTLLITVLAACAPAPESPSPLQIDEPLPTDAVLPADTPVTPTGANADVLFVYAELAEDGTWFFEVTVAHPDTGWDDYADGWDVVLPDGSVAKSAGGGPFTRLLAHPHENEQPFIRSQSGIILPEGITQVTVRAHDLVDGFGGQEVVVYLDQASGLNFEVESPQALPTSFSTGLTYLQPDGNRYLPGAIDLAQTTPISITISGTPEWIVGIEENEALRWLVATDDGKLTLIETADGTASSTSLSAVLPAGMPPALTGEAYGGILNYQNAEAPNTHPILTESGVLARLDGDGDLILAGKGGEATAEINALPDGRILSDELGQFLVLTDPTNEYGHAVLGDALEAKSATIVNEIGETTAKILAPADMVFEAIMPIWVDIDQDGTREIIVTASNEQIGAQLLVYQPDGTLVARSNPIGTGYRWRNQAAVAPFGPNGEMELVNVITPHLLGRVEFLQLKDDRLESVAEITGYTSHVIGSRNLDMVFSGDLDADGQAEVLLPTQDLRALGIIEHGLEGAAAIAELPLDGRLTSNLAGIDTSEGLAIAAGTENGTIYLWLP